MGKNMIQFKLFLSFYSFFVKIIIIFENFFLQIGVFKKRPKSKKVLKIMQQIFNVKNAKISTFFVIMCNLYIYNHVNLPSKMREIQCLL